MASRDCLGCHRRLILRFDRPIRRVLLVQLPIQELVFRRVRGNELVAPGYLQGMAAESEGKWLIGGAIVAQILGNFFIKKIINIKV